MGYLFHLVTVIALLQPWIAAAHDHDVKGCITIWDDRVAMSGSTVEDYSRTYEQYVPAVGAKIKIYAKDAFGGYPQTDTATTNSSGCFSGDANGLTIPKSTVVRTYIILESDDLKIVDTDNDIAGYDLGDISVGEGGTADYGTIRANSSNAWLMLWVTGSNMIDDYESRLGKSWSSNGYKKFQILYPTDYVKGVASTGADGIEIPEGQHDGLSAIYHEFGHWIAGEDASRESGFDSYCQDYSGSSFPYNLAPYIFEDPATDPDLCSWSSSAYEANERALSEGFANFARAQLWYGECTEDSETSAEFNFDDTHRVQNTQRTLCDLEDGANDSAAAIHTYGESGHVSQVDYSGMSLSTEAAVSDKYGFAISGGSKIYRINSAGEATEIADTTVSGGSSFQSLAADSDYFCFATTTKIYCRPILGNGDFTDFDRPSTSHTIFDITLSRGELYVLLRSSTEAIVYHATLTATTSKGSIMDKGLDKVLDKVLAARLSLSAWTTVYSETFGSDTWDIPREIAVSATRDRLFVSRDYRIDACVLTRASSLSSSCSAGQIERYAGSNSYGGYKRGGPKGSWFNNIGNLIQKGGRLYVTDAYGVARLDLTDTSADVEQLIGIGADNVFANNLARRSLKFSGSTSWFAPIDGYDLFYNSSTVKSWDAQRDPDYEPMLTIFNDDYDVRETTYCGTDELNLSLSTVFHGFKGQDTKASIKTFMSSYLGLSSSSRAKVEYVNWLSLNSSGCNEQDAYGTSQDVDISGDIEITRKVTPAVIRSDYSHDPYDFSAVSLHQKARPKSESVSVGALTLREGKLKQKSGAKKRK